MRLSGNLAFSVAAIAASTGSLVAASPVSSAPFTVRQAPNPDFPKDPFGQTASYNVTSFLLPISKDVAASLTEGLPLLDIPRGSLPEGYIKEDQHVLLCQSGLLYEIRQLILEIQQLQSANCYMPFVDGSRDGHTPFTYDLVNFQDKLVPIVAGSVQQSIRLEGASWRPPHDAFGTVHQLDPAPAPSKAADGDKDKDHTQEMQGSYGFKIALGLNIPANGPIGFLGLPLPPPIATLPLFSGEDGTDKTGTNIDEHRLALVATWDKDRDVEESDPLVKFVKGVVQSPYIHTYTRVPGGARTCGRTAWSFDESFRQLYTVRGTVLAFESIFPKGAQAFSDVLGVHVVAGWDNMFGPGVLCSELRDEANKIEY